MYLYIKIHIKIHSRHTLDQLNTLFIPIRTNNVLTVPMYNTINTLLNIMVSAQMMNNSVPMYFFMNMKFAMS